MEISSHFSMPLVQLLNDRTTKRSMQTEILSMFCIFRTACTFHLVPLYLHVITSLFCLYLVQMILKLFNQY